MSKKTEADRFTKVATSLLLDVKELVNWGMDTGNTTPELLTHAIAEDRQAHAVKLIEAGVTHKGSSEDAECQRKDNSAGRWLNLSTNGRTNVRTGSASTKARRADVAAKAEGAADIDAAAEKYRVVRRRPALVLRKHQAGRHTEQRDHYPVMGCMPSAPFR